MTKSKKGRSGKKNLSLTRNQKRKLDYAKEREAERGSRKNVRSKRPAGKTFVHKLPCGNIACRKCYVRYLGIGIFPKEMEGHLDVQHLKKKIAA